VWNRVFLTGLLALLGANFFFATLVTAADDEADSFDLLGEFPTSEASSRIKPFQVRMYALYGNLTFASSRASSGSSLSLDGVQAGTRIEIEHWFQAGKLHRRNFGLLADGQFLYAGTFKQVPGPPVSYSSASILMGYRVWGYGHTVPWTPELTLFLGPAIEYFPSMSAFTGFFGGFGYNLNNPGTLGAKAGARLRFPLFSRFTAIEATGYYIHPLEMIAGANGGQVDFSQTKSLGATCLLDVRLSHAMLFGGGFYWGWFKLNYTPNGAPGPDVTTFYTQALVVSFRFNI
jgi:hypothetical protein